MNCSSGNSRIIFNQFSLASHQPFFNIFLELDKIEIFFYILNVVQAAQFLNWFFYDIEYEYPCYPPIRSLYQTRVCGHHNYSKHRVITDKINPLNKLMFTKLNSL